MQTVALPVSRTFEASVAVTTGAQKAIKRTDCVHLPSPVADLRAGEQQSRHAHRVGWNKCQRRLELVDRVFQLALQRKCEGYAAAQQE